MRLFERWCAPTNLYRTYVGTSLSQVCAERNKVLKRAVSPTDQKPDATVDTEAFVWEPLFKHHISLQTL